MNKIVTFEGQPPEGTINFGVGQPSADLLPLELMQLASEDFFSSAEPLDLNYGVLQGDQRFLESLARFLTKNYARQVDSSSLFVTAGNSQGLDLICSHLAKAGDIIIVEEPCYFLAYQIFADHGLKIVSVPVDNDGLIIEELEEVLKKTSPAMLYTIPSFQNPSGHTLSLERRKRLIELSQQHNFLILADEVYQLLSYFDSPPAALGTLSEGDTVVSLGSFSKILSPALRLGWIQTSNERVMRLTRIGYVNSGGSVNHHACHIVRHAIEMGLLQAHLEHLRSTYKGRVEAMDAALTEHLSEHVSWIRPDGGYFFWLELNNNISGEGLSDKASKMDVGFQAGDLFSSCGGMKNFIRLSFAYYNEQEISEGIARIKPLFEK